MLAISLFAFPFGTLLLLQFVPTILYTAQIYLQPYSALVSMVNYCTQYWQLSAGLLIQGKLVCLLDLAIQFNIVFQGLRNTFRFLSCRCQIYTNFSVKFLKFKSPVVTIFVSTFTLSCKIYTPVTSLLGCGDSLKKCQWRLKRCNTVCSKCCTVKILGHDNLRAISFLDN